MNGEQVSNASLHYTIVQHIIEHGYAPDVHELAGFLQASEAEIIRGLERLQEDHGLVLHPRSPKIWVIHPFSLAPTNFLVHCADGEWWGNCAWCSLGAAALLERDVTITTTLGANDRQVDIHIQDGRVVEDNYLIHFPVPMHNAWDNVIYTCSTMLLFENEQQIERWCERHRIPKGDVEPIEKIWEFSRAWYGNHLNPNWKKWTSDEARQIFKQFGLSHPIWEMPGSGGRF